MFLFLNAVVCNVAGTFNIQKLKKVYFMPFPCSMFVSFSKTEFMGAADVTVQHCPVGGAVYAPVPLPCPVGATYTYRQLGMNTFIRNTMHVIRKGVFRWNNK